MAWSDILLAILRPMVGLLVDSWEGAGLDGRNGEDRGGAGGGEGRLLTEFLLPLPSPLPLYLQESKYLASLP